MTDDQTKNELALSTLLTVAAKVAPELSRDLLERVFALQTTHQFDRDRSVSLQEMEKLVEQYAVAHEEDRR